MHLRIMKWRARNIDNKYYEDILGPDGDFVDFSQMEMEGPNEDALREEFLGGREGARVARLVATNCSE